LRAGAVRRDVDLRAGQQAQRVADGLGQHNPAGLIDITRFWYEQGSLDNERKVADNLKYQVENRAIAGVRSILMKPNDANGSCGVASDAGVNGVVGWWVNPQTPGIDACGMATKLMELTLATNA